MTVPQTPNLLATHRQNGTTTNNNNNAHQIQNYNHTRHHNPLARELLIAELAVQRAALLTKRVLRTLENLPPPSPTCVTPIQGGRQHLRAPWHPLSSSAQDDYLSQGRRLSVAKPDASPVTIADFAAQALLISAIHGAFPQDSFVGEEDANALRQDPDMTRQVWDLVSSTRLADPAAEALLARPGSVEEMYEMIDLGGRGLGGSSETSRFWALDPIDGTSAFLKGGQYAVSLALIQGGREILGVLGCPNLPPRLLADASANAAAVQLTEENVDRDGMGLMLSAVRGQGSVTARPMAKGGLSPQTTAIRRGRAGKVDKADLHFVDSTLSTATVSRKVQALSQRAGARHPRTEIYSSHMRYAAMILGERHHVQVRFPVSKPAASSQWCLWDHSGSQLLFTESGAGVVTDLMGRPIDFGTGRKLSNNWGIITADASVYDEVLELVTEMLEEENSS